jgi:hypothetical protein
MAEAAAMQNELAVNIITIIAPGVQRWAMNELKLKGKLVNAKEVLNAFFSDEG